MMLALYRMPMNRRVTLLRAKTSKGLEPGRLGPMDLRTTRALANGNNLKVADL